MRVLIDSDPALNPPLQWWAGQAGTVPVHGTATLGMLPAADRLEWLIHPARVGLHALSLPRQTPAKLRALLPHALEDELLIPVETLHLAMKHAADGKLAARSVDRAWLQSWLDYFGTVQRPPQAAWALADLLPHGPDWLAVELNQGALLRSAAGEASWLDDAALIPAIAADAPLSHLELNALALQAGADVNLLQGEFAPRTSPRINWWSWRRAGALAGVSLALWLASDAVHWWQLRQSVNELRRSMRQSYAAAFPGEPVVDPALQLASKLRQTGAKASTLVARLQQLDGAGVAAGAISQISYQNDRLTLELTPAAADAVTARLNAAGEKFTREPVSGDRVRLQW
ncbi:hypothetical protein JHS3_14530 [Jeongeupia sp. HS-3]|nr:hypothetical protein JHS3_14530 [Jeongeupia sp. HS-3]